MVGHIIVDRSGSAYTVYCGEKNAFSNLHVGRKQLFTLFTFIYLIYIHFTLFTYDMYTTS